MHHVNRLLWQSVARVLIGIGLLGVLLLSVGPSDFGAYTGCLATASMFGAASCLGFDRVMLISDPDEYAALRKVCVLIAVVLGAAAGATCWLVSIQFATRDMGRESIDVAGQWAIGFNGFFQLVGTAAILCTSQFLIREGRFNAANLCLSLPSTLVLGAQVISVRVFGSSVSSLATGAIVGWISILLVVFFWSINSATLPSCPVRPVLQRWWKPATIRMGTGIFSNARTQLGYLVILLSTPFGAELLAAVRLFDTGGSAVSGVLERSWGTILASITCSEGVEAFEVKSDALIDDFARWIRKLSIFCLPGLGVAAFVGKTFVPDQWSFILEVAPPLLVAIAIAAQMAWLERLFEYQRRFSDGLWTELLITVTLLSSYSLLLPTATSITACAWMFGGIYASAMLARGHASMKRGVSRSTSRGLLKTVASVASLAGLIVWTAQVMS
jgi:O-antigen/teichoic acid export membrane protein